MKPVRVLYHYASSHLDTGSPRALLELVKLVQSIPEYEPVYLAGEPGDLPEAMEALGVEVRGPMKTASVSPRAPLRGVRQVWRWTRILKEWRVDLLHLNEVGWNTDLVLGAALARVPVVLHAHNPTRIYRKNMNRLVAEALFVPSSALIEQIEGRDLLRARIEVLANAVDLTRFSEGKNIRRNLGVSDEEVLVLFVGQICERKGVDIVVDVARALRDEGSRAIFLLAGPEAVGEREYANAIRSRIVDAGLEERVRLLGSRDDIPDLMATADLFFLPTRREPFGIVFLEAMAAGVAVVGTNVGGVPEVVGQDTCGILVDGLNPNDFAQAVLSLERNPDARKKMGMKGQVRAKAVFGPDAIRTAIRNAYGRALGDREAIA